MRGQTGRSRRTLLVAGVLGALLPLAPAGHAAARDPGLTTLMSYNLRVDVPIDLGHRAWPRRLPLVAAVVAAHRPDLVGVQEPYLRQVEELTTRLPGYGWLGHGLSDGKRAGMSNAVLYRTDRYQVLGQRYFWLSGTPEEPGSKGWGNFFVRGATVAELRDRSSGGRLYLVNTHFDHASENARRRSAQLLLSRVRALDPGVPVLVTGDFNTDTTTSVPYQTLTGPDALTDAWQRAGQRLTPSYRTNNGWQAPVEAVERIDWILTRGPVRTEAVSIDTFRGDGHHPSDHWPVIARLRVG